ncbi:MAG: hypothetical protein JRC77_09600 [Deltaproteobacteria bacterium]|nr:hypothetical protein [Deltaproteobacteria bacterium]
MIVTPTGREDSPIIGIFTERDVLHRVVDRCIVTLLVDSFPPSVIK